MGASVLYMAAQEGHDDVVRLLLAHPNVEVNSATTDTGYTVLMIAAFAKHKERQLRTFSAKIDLTAYRHFC